LWLHDLIRGQVSGSQPVTDENLIPSLLLQKKNKTGFFFPATTLSLWPPLFLDAFTDRQGQKQRH
jgi:hypothetical protein